MCSVKETVIDDENDTLFTRKSIKAYCLGIPMSILKENNIFEKVISIKYDIPNDKLSMFDDYKVAIDNFYADILAENA